MRARQIEFAVAQCHHAEKIPGIGLVGVGLDQRPTCFAGFDEAAATTGLACLLDEIAKARTAGRSVENAHFYDGLPALSIACAGKSACLHRGSILGKRA